MTSNKGASYLFRSELVHVMHEAGWHKARRAPEPKLPTEKKLTGSVIGLPFTVVVRNAIQIDLSASVDDAKRKAAAEGNPFGFAVQNRRSFPTTDAFVVCDVTTWLAVMAQLYPGQVSDLADTA